MKDNQPKLAESIATYFDIGQAENWKNTPHTYVESVEKDHGRLEVRRCLAFTQLDCLANPQQWPDLKMFGAIEAERTKNAGANLAIIRRLVLNLFHLDTSKRKGGIYTRRILAASSDSYAANLLGLERI